MIPQSEAKSSEICGMILTLESILCDTPAQSDIQRGITIEDFGEQNHTRQATYNFPKEYPYSQIILTWDKRTVLDGQNIGVRFSLNGEDGLSEIKLDFEGWQQIIQVSQQLRQVILNKYSYLKDVNQDVVLTEFAYALRFLKDFLLTKTYKAV